MNTFRISLVWLSLLLVGTAIAQETSSVYATAGPHAMIIDDSVELNVRDGQKPMALRVAYPDSDGPWPLIVYSHGTFASKDKYMPIVAHWVSHGNLVMLPDHIDANRGVMVRQASDMENVIRSRAMDMSLLLDHLDQVIDEVPALRDNLRPPPYTAAGHSVGTYVAMLVNGLEVRNPETGKIMRQPEQRYGAIVMSSDPGKMALMPEDVWLGTNMPTFLATGPEDYGLMGDGRAPTTYESEVLTGQDGPGGDRYLLQIDGLDHYFGGLVHREPGNTEPDHEALAIFNELSTAFIAAYAHGDASALAWLGELDDRNAISQRVTLTRH